MATSDISRSAFEQGKHYTGVRMQQGRVLTDEDWNADRRIGAEDLRRTRADVIGPAGTPDDGFRIQNPRADADGNVEFDIGAGTFYLGGRRLALEDAQTFRTQTDRLLLPPDAHPAPAAERTDLVYLVTYEVPVEAVEDAELFEVGLGGPDTTTRTRTVQQVVLREGVEGDCADAWDALVQTWEANGVGRLSDDHELRPDVRLTVGYQPGGDPDDLCTPLAAGGYLGAENQAIRVQLVDRDHLTWGFDNAAPLYRVEAAADRQTLTLLTPPRDQAHWPLADQTVEVLPWDAVLPNGEKVAGVRGHLTRVSASYQPDDGTLVLADAIPTDPFDHWQSRPDVADLEGDGAYYYLRVWNRGADLASDPAIPFTPGTPLALGTTGLEVTVEGPDRIPADHWIIAARPETPNQVVPWSLETGRRPHGIRRFYAPLALVRWQPVAGGSLTADVLDCREPFLPLTRQGTCCTLRVGDGSASHGQYDSIQAAVDALPPSGGQVCVLPGVYHEAVVLDGLRDVAITGCGRRSLVDASALEDGDVPAITVRGGEGVRIEGLAVEAADDAPGVLVEGIDNQQGLVEEPERVRLLRLHVRAARRSAVEVAAAHGLVVRQCRLTMRDTASVWPALWVSARDACIERNTLAVVAEERQPPPLAERPIEQPINRPIEQPVNRPVELRLRQPLAEARSALGGMQLAGGCENVRVEENRIVGGLGHGITLGSLREVRADGGRGPSIGWVVNRFDPCNPCAPGDTYIPPRDDDEEDETRLESDGALYDLRIARNTIRDMGMCGIGVVGFFSLEEDDQFVSVFGLDVVGNEIEGCLRRELAEIPSEMVDAMGYGGIALADVSDLVVRENRIVGNGPSRREPVCGVFVLHGEGLAFVENEIGDNGAWARIEAQRPGRRGGIHVVFSVAPVAPPLDDDVPQSGRSAAAARVHGNTVQAPLGQALTLRAFGPVHVTDNRFTSQGVVVGSDYTTLAAATVGILNLAVAPELAALGSLARPSQVATGEAIAQPTLSNRATPPSLEDDGPFLAAPVREGQPGLDDFAAGVHPAGGGVLFCDNQCLLDLSSTDQEFLFSSVLVLGLDDVAFEDNQVLMRSGSDLALLDALVLGFSVRAVGNRFSEQFVRLFLSAVTFGLMNTTAANQSTYCIYVRGVPSLTVNGPNTSLVDGLVSLDDGFCGRITEFLNGLFKRG